MLEYNHINQYDLTEAALIQLMFGAAYYILAVGAVSLMLLIR